MKKFLILVFAFSIGTVAIHAETINVTPGAVLGQTANLAVNSIALGGATIGDNKLAVAGSALFQTGENASQVIVLNPVANATYPTEQIMIKAYENTTQPGPAGAGIIFGDQALDITKGLAEDFVLGGAWISQDPAHGQILYELGQSYTSRWWTAPAPYPGAVTISNATPAVITLASHGLTAGASFYLKTTGALPAPLLAPASFIGSISGTTLNVTQMISGTLAVGLTVGDMDLHTKTATIITGLGSGSGGIGTYTVNQSQTNVSDTFVAGQVLYVISAGLGANSFEFSLTSGGAAVNTSTAGSGTQTLVSAAALVQFEVASPPPSVGGTGALTELAEVVFKATADYSVLSLWVDNASGTSLGSVTRSGEFIWNAFNTSTAIGGYSMYVNGPVAYSDVLGGFLGVLRGAAGVGALTTPAEWNSSGTDFNFCICSYGAVEFIVNSGASSSLTLGTSGGLFTGAATGGDKGAGTINAAAAYYSNGTVGLTCSGTPTSSFASTLGIVTHC